MPWLILSEDAPDAARLRAELSRCPASFRMAMRSATPASACNTSISAALPNSSRFLLSVNNVSATRKDSFAIFACSCV